MRVSRFLNEQEAEEIYAAYHAVFDNDGEIKACGRDACIHLIRLMKKHTSSNIGDENTGRINIEVMKDEYDWLWGFTLTLNRIGMIFECDFLCFL